MMTGVTQTVEPDPGWVYLHAARYAAHKQMAHLKRVQDDILWRKLVRLSTPEVVFKQDESRQLEHDRVSGRIGRDIMRNSFPEDRIYSEEGGFSGPSDARYTDAQDELDGSTAFDESMPTFCVAHGRYDNNERRVVAALLMDVRDHAVMYKEGIGTFVELYPDKGRMLVPCHAEPVADFKKAGIYVDVSRHFSKTLLDGGKKEIITLDQKLALLTGINTQAKAFRIPGSNALQQLLVSMVPDGAAGGYMTAPGGPQDTIGAACLVGAGCTVRAFTVDGHKLIEVDPLDIFQPDGNGYDLLAYGRDAKTAGKLVDILAGAYKR